MEKPAINDVLAVANRAAHEAGAILMQHFGQLSQIRHKSAVDLVTEADLASEAAIVKMIRTSFPQHNILAEEGDYEAAANPEFRWVIDPLDGTTNYVHGLPLFAVSIAFQIKGITELGIVFNPALNELFMAQRGRGATLNGQPLQVSDVGHISEALLVTGFPYTRDKIFTRSFDLFASLYPMCQGVRRLGAAALDCCYVAAGRFDAFYEANLQPWDICAGDLICRAAGGRTSDWTGGELPFDGHRVLMSNGHLHDELMNIISASPAGKV